VGFSETEQLSLVGIECAEYFNYQFESESDPVALDNISNPVTACKKIVEKIEYLLSPSAKSLHLTIQVAKKHNDAKKQKPKVLELIDEYVMRTFDNIQFTHGCPRFNLTNYTTENVINKKISEIDVPEEAFGAWLTGYRNLLARRAQQEDDPEYAPWG
jgi:hypothetical protein